MKVVTYKRVSTGKQAKSGLGLEAQQEYLDIALSQLGEYELCGEYVDAGVSGGLPVSEREGLRNALVRCKATGSCLMVAKLDRLSRSVSDIALLIEELPCLKVATMMQADKFQLHLFAALAEQEKTFIQERTKAALKQLQNRADNGDQVAKSKIDNRNKGIVEIHKRGNNRKQSLIVRQARSEAFIKKIEDNILAARARGCKSFQAVADYLNNKGIKTVRGSEWTATGVRRVEMK